MVPRKGLRALPGKFERVVHIVVSEPFREAPHHGGHHVWLGTGDSPYQLRTCLDFRGAQRVRFSREVLSGYVCPRSAQATLSRLGGLMARPVWCPLYVVQVWSNGGNEEMLGEWVKVLDLPVSISVFIPVYGVCFASRHGLWLSKWDL